MSDTLKKVKSGDPLKIPAATFNTFVDSAQDYLQRQQGTGQRPTQSFRQTGIVPVKNASGADAPRFAVLGIDSPMFSPAESLETFTNTVALKGITPVAASHAGTFVILQEPVADGEIGRAVVSGVTPVKIDVTDAGHKYADVNDGQSGTLASAASGSSLILWAESGTGEKWAVVKMGMPATEAGSSVFPAKIISSSGNALYVVREQSLTGAGAFQDKAGSANVTAKNTAELYVGPGNAVDTAEIVQVLHMLDASSNDRYVFDRPPFAKYLD